MKPAFLMDGAMSPTRHSNVKILVIDNDTDAGFSKLHLEKESGHPGPSRSDNFQTMPSSFDTSALAESAIVSAANN